MFYIYATSLVTVTINTSIGTPAKGVVVEFKPSTLAGAIFEPANKEVSTNTQGKAVLTVKSTGNGVLSIQAATQNNPAVTKTASTTFKWYEVSGLTADKTAGVVANDKDSSTLSAPVFGLDGKTAAPAGISVTFTKPADVGVHFEGQAGTVKTIEVKTNAQGIATAQVLGTKAGTYSFTAKTTGDGSNAGKDKSIAIEFVGITTSVSNVRVDSSTAVEFGTPGNKVLYTFSPSDYKGQFVFTSSDDSVATVDAKGTITWKKTGLATFTVAIPVSDQYIATSGKSAVAVYSTDQASLFQNGVPNWDKGFAT